MVVAPMVDAIMGLVESYRSAATMYGKLKKGVMVVSKMDVIWEIVTG